MIRHYADAMRAKRRGLAVLAVLLVALIVWLLKGDPGHLGIAVGWAALIGGVIAGNRLTRCPACGKTLGGLFEKLCSHCGALLTDEPVMPPSVKGPVDPRAAAFMGESRRILERWGAVRRKLGGKTIALVGFVGALALFLSFWLHRPEDLGVAAGIALFLWPVISGVYWLILIYGADNLFSIWFLLTRGRCPVCRAWINPPSTLGPESIHVDVSLPSFCPSCSAKLS